MKKCSMRSLCSFDTTFISPCPGKNFFLGRREIFPRQGEATIWCISFLHLVEFVKILFCVVMLGLTNVNINIYTL